jgi:hypothetical protein
VVNLKYQTDSNYGNKYGSELEAKLSTDQCHIFTNHKQLESKYGAKLEGKMLSIVTEKVKKVKKKLKLEILKSKKAKKKKFRSKNNNF